MKKRAITLTLALLMCLSCALPASASGGSRFTDVPDNAWYAEAVNAMADGGVLSGKGNGKFDPDAPVTLAELSVIYCRLMGREVKAEYVHWAGSAMHVSGLGIEYSESDYGPWDVDPTSYTEFPYADTPAYRADAFYLLAGWMDNWGLLNFNPGYDLADYIPSYSEFDKNRIPDRDEYEAACTCASLNWIYYLKNGHCFRSHDIDAAYDLGLTHGVDANFTCDALGTLTRAQLAQMCYNMGWTTVGSFTSSIPQNTSCTSSI